MPFDEKDKFLLKIYPLHTNKQYCLFMLSLNKSPSVCSTCKHLLIPTVTCKTRLEDKIWVIECTKCKKTTVYPEEDKTDSSSEFEILNLFSTAS